MFCESENGISDFPTDMWNEIVEYLKLWKKNLPDMPEVNFDLNSEQVFLEIKDLSPCIYRKLFENVNLKVFFVGGDPATALRHQHLEGSLVC